VTSQRARATTVHVGETLFERFEVRDELGSGAFGRVLLCRDVDSGEEIALKELHRFGADALLRFKKEFRSLSDVQHPNLVRFGELLEGEGQWAFTLEYVPGTDVRSWVRTAATPHGFDEARLRDALVQLTHGLMVIHSLGLLHRDVKPQNVRVRPDGHVVLLDFGLVTHLSHGQQTSEVAAVGTAAYMAPEQANEERLGPSADWYALGVLLYELLTGKVPFTGSSLQIMLAKQGALPASPAMLVAGVPADLDALCMRLLAARPIERPDGDGVLAALSASAGSTIAPPVFQARGEELFVGRTTELAALQRQFAQAMQSGVQLVLLEGESGIGKSALVEHFVDALEKSDPSALVLRGRCHPAEQLGYKAFDGAVDELSRFLKSLPDEECRDLLPEQVHLLPVLFPVLFRLVAVAGGVPATKRDRVERYPLFAAFIELLARVGAERCLVLAVDDLQWADEASLVLLKSLLDSRRTPRLFIVGTVRPLAGLEDVIGDGLRALAGHERISRLAVGPLGEADTRRLLARLTGDADDGRITKLLAAESGGHPLFVTELVRHSASNAQGVNTTIDLDAAILRRVRALDVAPRLALELVCVASGPMPQAVLRDALAASADVAQPLIAMLRSQRLVRAAKRGEVVSYHDRMREAVLGAIDPGTLSGYHRKLAAAWQMQPKAEPARVAQHWLECGEVERATPWLLQAAEKAEQGGAFERAVEHYGRLLKLEGVPLSREQRHQVKLRLSEAMAGAGRCADSARVLLEALDGAGEREAADLVIRAAQRLLQAGKIEEGLAAAKQAFELIGMTWPKTRMRVVSRLLYNRAAISLSGFEAKHQPNGAVDEQAQIELDAMRRLVLPLIWADFLRQAELASRHTRLALRSGDPGHLAYALHTEATLGAMQQVAAEKNDPLFEKAERWKKVAGTVELEAYGAYVRGTAAIFGKHMQEAESHLEVADRLYRQHCPGAVWELTNVRGVLLSVWHARGRFAHHAAHSPAWLDEAVARGDAFARATYVVTGHSCVRFLLRDKPALAAAEIEQAMQPWRSQSVGIQHIMEAMVKGLIYAYDAGQGSAGYWEEVWPRLSKSLLFKIPGMREMLVAKRLLTLIALVSSGDTQQSTRARARELVGMLHKPQSLVGRQFGRLLCAQWAWLDGQREGAEKLARESHLESERQGTFYARLADVLLARAEGAANALERERRVLDWFASEGWAKPERGMFAFLPVARSWQ